VIRPLVFKELREHRWVLVALWLFGALGLLGLLQSAKDEGSPLSAFRTLTCVFGVLAILTLANRLVVREFTGRTQLFLETLPVSRAQVIGVKWLTGAMLMAIPIAVGLAVILRVASSQVVLTPHFIGLIAARSGAFLMFAYALAFLIALTGRYRYLLWGGLVLGAYATDSLAQFPMDQWPPLHLVSASMAFERAEWPTTDLVVTVLITASLIASTFILALIADGSLVLALSRRMSPREKVAVTIGVIVLTSLVGQMEGRKPKPPFSLNDAVNSNSAGYGVAVARAEHVAESTARALANEISMDLQGLRQYLSLTALPGVFVLPDASIDADIFLRAALPSSDGVVLRAAINAEHFDQQEFRSYAVEQMLDWYTHTRAVKEDRRWLLDGFTQWWVARDAPARQELLTVRAAVAMQILDAKADKLEAELRDWLMAREQLGDCLSNALAWRAVSLLASELGPERFRKLMSDLFGRSLPGDSRAPFLETSVDSEWGRVNAPSRSKYVDALRAALQADKANAAKELQAAAHWRAAFEASAMGGRAFEVHYRLDGGETTKTPFAVRYGAIGAWERELDRERLARVDATHAGVLPIAFQAGTRLFTAIEMRDSQLACTLRIGARRWDIP
jgi:hypothetical protein